MALKSDNLPAGGVEVRHCSHFKNSGFGQYSVAGVRFVSSLVACVASVSVQFGSKELQGDEWSE